MDSFHSYFLAPRLLKNFWSCTAASCMRDELRQRTGGQKGKEAWTGLFKESSNFVQKVPQVEN